MINSRKVYVFKLNDSYLNGKFLTFSNEKYVKYILDIYEDSVLLNFILKKFITVCLIKCKLR